MFISRASSFGRRLLVLVALQIFLHCQSSYYTHPRLIYRRFLKNHRKLLHTIWSFFPILCICFQMKSIDFTHNVWLQIVSLLALYLQIGIYIPNLPQGCFADSFQGLWFGYAKHHGHSWVCQTSSAQNCNQVMHVEQSMIGSHCDEMMRSICWCFFACYRLWRHPCTVLLMTNNFINVWEEQHRYTHSQIHHTISGIVPLTTSEEVSFIIWIIFLQACRWRPNSSSRSAQTYIITRTYEELDFLSSVLQANIYSRDPAGWLAYRSELYRHQSMFSIRQDVLTRRVLFRSVLPLFRN